MQSDTIIINLIFTYRYRVHSLASRTVRGRRQAAAANTMAAMAASLRPLSVSFR
jgi:hypothetical protein